MRRHLRDIELSELGTVVGDGDDRLVGQVLAAAAHVTVTLPARVSGWKGWAEVTGAVVVPLSRAGLALTLGWGHTCVWRGEERGR